jgi:hypothetical protein
MESAKLIRQKVGTMRYFTRGWTNGSYDDDLADRVRSEYWSRVEVLRPEMPPSILKLATQVHLHDALIDSLTWRPHKRLLELVLISSAGRDEPVKWLLRYGGVSLNDDYLRLFGERVRDRRTEVLYDEVDRDQDGTWSHRILLHPFGETSIWFSELEVQETAHRDGRWDRVGCDPFSVIDWEEDEPEEGDA